MRLPWEFMDKCSFRFIQGCITFPFYSTWFNTGTLRSLFLYLTMHRAWKWIRRRVGLAWTGFWMQEESSPVPLGDMMIRLVKQIEQTGAEALAGPQAFLIGSLNHFFQTKGRIRLPPYQNFLFNLEFGIRLGASPVFPVKGAFILLLKLRVWSK